LMFQGSGHKGMPRREYRMGSYISSRAKCSALHDKRTPNQVGETHALRRERIPNLVQNKTRGRLRQAPHRVELPLSRTSPRFVVCKDRGRQWASTRYRQTCYRLMSRQASTQLFEGPPCGWVVVHRKK
jgi:hypothetical protein